MAADNSIIIIVFLFLLLVLAVFYGRNKNPKVYMRDCGNNHLVQNALSGVTLADCMVDCDNVPYGKCHDYCRNKCNEKFPENAACTIAVLKASNADNCCMNCSQCPDPQSCKVACQRNFNVSCDQGSIF